MKENGFGIASMILGIIGLLFSCCYGIGFFPALLGTLFGAIGLAQKEQSHSTAIAGLTCSIITIPLSIVAIFFETVFYDYITKLD